MAIRNRIKELRQVPASSLKPSPLNWRGHPEKQRKVMQAIFGDVGIADAMKARELADGSLELIDGHMRTDELKDQIVPVLILDLNDEEAKKILLTFDAISAMAVPDDERIAELVAQIDTDDDDLDALLKEMEGELADVEPKDLPKNDHFKPPIRTWVLIGLDTNRYGEIAETIERIAAIPDVVCEITTSSSTPEIKS